jgi:hypothetical protein
MLGEAPETLEWVEDGRELLVALGDAVHGQRDPRSLDQASVRHWQRYGWKIEAAAKMMGRPVVNEWLASNRGTARQVAARAGRPPPRG